MDLSRSSLVARRRTVLRVRAGFDGGRRAGLWLRVGVCKDTALCIGKENLLEV